MKILLLLVGLVTVAQADETSWNSFQTKYGKKYKNPTEYQLRQNVFNDNLQKIEENNKNYKLGVVSYQLGVNQFADLTDEEFADMFKTLEVDKAIMLGEEKKHDLTIKNMKELPASIDWRTKSAVTDVKSQGECGACWAFSAVGSIEGQVAIHTGQLKSLSAQQLIDCDTDKSEGCKGGYEYYTCKYIAENGLTLEQNYPFQEEQQTCDTLKSKPPVVWTEKYVEIIRNNETDLKQAVGLVGPVSVSINPKPIKLYTNGVFDSSCSDATNHGLLAVGYGTDKATGKEYWILKNSWGQDWGDQGYVKLRMGKNLCGVAKQAYYPIINLTSYLKPNSGYSVKGGLFSFVFLVYYCISISLVNL